MTRIAVRLFLLATLVLLPALSFGCGIEAWDVNSPIFSLASSDWTFGEVFVPNRDMWVIFLGYYIAPGNNPTYPWIPPTPVALYSGTGELLRSTVVSNAPPNFFDEFHPVIGYGSYGGDFLFKEIQPIKIYAGQTYVLEGESNYNFFTFDQPMTVYLPITVLGQQLDTQQRAQLQWHLNHGECLGHRLRRPELRRRPRAGQPCAFRRRPARNRCDASPKAENINARERGERGSNHKITLNAVGMASLLPFHILRFACRACFNWCQPAMFCARPCIIL